MVNEIRLDIADKDLVLEVGSGHNPYLRSNVLCDRYLFNNKQRSFYNLKYDRPLVIAKGSKLPFKNKAFDYVICSQVIEHVSNPAAFAKELARVGKRGVIVCPHMLREGLFGWPEHQWLIEVKNKHLTFYAKNKQFFPLSGNFFHQLYQKKLFFQRFCQENDNVFNIYYFWQKKIKINISQDKPEISKLYKKLNLMLAQIEYNSYKDAVFMIKKIKNRFFNKTAKEAKKLFWTSQQFFDSMTNLKMLKKMLVCPSCLGGLKISQSILCQKCGQKFKIHKNIPILLT